ncbi:MAG: response regulator [Cyanobacteria bacterium]|jgi:twitching motility two-component system response regulator PilG|nr:response regulator [Cyanobacteria bacterium GSL.Bin21]
MIENLCLTSSEFLATQHATGQIHDSFQLFRELSNRSGVLEISRENINWIIYLEKGQLQYASMSVQSLEELTYHLQYSGCKAAVEALKTAKSLEKTQHSLEDMSLDSILHWLSRQEFMNAQQVSHVTEQLSREALEPLFWLKDGHYTWQESDSTEPLVSMQPRLPLATLVEQFQGRIKSWQKLLDKISSPYQRPYFFNHHAVDAQANPLIAKLSKLMRGFSIHQLATIIKQDEIKLAQILYPYIKSGEIFLRDPKSSWGQLPKLPKLPKKEPQNNVSSRPSIHQKTIKIACVDDSPTILREMQRLLGEEPYEITKIENPVEAAAILFRVKPDLILMDISMPEINGYKLCSLLRNSNALAEVPIIMVTSRTGVIDKVRAKASGATDYLTKPFTKVSLLDVIQKHLH